MDKLCNCTFLLCTVVITNSLDKFVFTTLTHECEFRLTICIL